MTTFFALINDVSFAETISPGHDLFFDKRLSASDLVSCASCGIATPAQLTG